MTASHADSQGPRDLTRSLTLRFSALLFLFLVLSGGTYIAVTSTVTAKEYDSVIVNLAGRQRMLTQKYAREIAQVVVSMAVSDRETAAEMKEAASQTAELLEETLAALREGGEVDTGREGRIWIPPPQDAELVERLEHVKTEWEELHGMAVLAIRSNTLSLENNDCFSNIQAQTAIAVAEMDHAVSLMQKQSEARLHRVESHTIWAGILSAMLFVGTVVFVRRKIVVPLANSLTALETKRAESERFHRVIDDSLNEIYIFDSETLHFVHVNYGARKNTGYSMAELREMTPLSLKPEFAAESFAELVRPLRAGTQERVQFDTMYRRKDGSEYPVEVHLQLMDHDSPVFVAIILDITERKQSEEDLRTLSVAVEQSPAMVVITDTNGTIEYVNPRFTEVTGYTKEEAIGQNPRILKSGEWRKKAHEGLWKTILAGKTWRGEFENKKKNGELYWESASISPVRNAQGDVTHFLIVKEDITERKQAQDALEDHASALRLSNAALQEAQAAAEAANMAKSAFLANMSHEIRTPMTAILGFSENLLDRDADESERHDCVMTIHRNAEHLLEIINDILDVSKIEAGKAEVLRQPCSLAGIVDDVVTLMEPRAKAKGLTFRCERVEPIPHAAETDPVRLRQILINLISNAVKFTEAGGVRMILSLVRPGGDEPAIQFDVVDTGIGMTAKQMGRLFRPFAQADETVTRKFGGTGLGLAISKALANLLGGDITVESEVGRGSTFRLTIAAGSFEGLELTTPAIAPSKRTVRRNEPLDCRVLLAEDGPDNQRLIEFVLEKAGADVTVVENGRRAVDLLIGCTPAGGVDSPPRFDVVLMDMQMPVMDGYTATRLLRRRGYEGPIIALTAHAMSGDRERCIEAGCDDYATKPIDRAALIETVARHRGMVAQRA